MTDKQIIEAVADIMFGENKKCGFRNCNLACEVLDLINRQKAEIERLNEVINGFEEQSRKELMDFMALSEKYEKARAEAVKEFAERLKMLKCHYSETEYTFDFDGVTVDDIDNLVKEMTEDEGK